MQYFKIKDEIINHMQMDMAFIQTIANNNEHMLQMFLKILCGVKVVYDDKLKQKNSWKIYVQIKIFIQIEPRKNVLSFWFKNGIMQHMEKWLGFQVGDGYKYAHIYLSHIALLNCCWLSQMWTLNTIV